MQLKLPAFIPLLLSLSISSTFATTNDAITHINAKSYSLADLLQQQSSMNEDLNLLKKRTADNHGTYLISGGIAAQYFQNHNNAPGSKSSDGFALSTAEIDTEFTPTPWVTALLGVEYNSNKIVAGQRKLNGKLELSKGFVTLGNLHDSPFYLTVGKMRAPFGQGSSAMKSSSPAKVLGNIYQPTGIFGYQKNNINALAFSYQNAAHNLEHGARVSVDTPIGKRTLSLSTSYVSNIADASGSQDNGLNSAHQFNGFNHNGYVLKHDVAGADIAARLSQGPVSISAEYISAIKKYDRQDLSQNHHAAQPRSIQIEADYTGKMGPRPYTVGLRYGLSKDTLALNLPRKSVSLGLSTSYWKNSMQSIEVRKDFDYANDVTASGSGASQAIVGDGLHHLNITVESGFYF
jgi:hypothetical protein